jgi:hypothetical protein
MIQQRKPFHGLLQCRGGLGGGLWILGLVAGYPGSVPQASFQHQKRLVVQAQRHGQGQAGP